MPSIPSGAKGRSRRLHCKKRIPTDSPLADKLLETFKGGNGWGNGVLRSGWAVSIILGILKFEQDISLLQLFPRLLSWTQRPLLARSKPCVAALSETSVAHAARVRKKVFV